MDFAAIAALIQQIGFPNFMLLVFVFPAIFPAICTGVLFWMLYKDRKAHREESKQWCESIDHNTDVMEKVLSHLEGARYDHG